MHDLMQKLNFMNQTKIIARSEFRNLPDMGLPFYARSTGHYIFDGNYKESTHKDENFVQVFWGVTESGKIMIDDQVYRLHPGDVIWKGSGSTHGYHSDIKGWELRWLTFDGPLADSIMESYNYPHYQKNSCPCPVHLFSELEKGLRRMTPYDMRLLCSVVLYILAHAGGRSSGDPVSDWVCELYIKLVQANYMRESVNVKTLADMMHMHRTTLTRHFQNVMKISPGDYLKQIRMQRAISLLKERRLTAAEVGCEVGIPNSTQFCHTVREFFGKSPKELKVES